jgi:transcriptional regulator with XRE-family HTH domain
MLLMSKLSQKIKYARHQKGITQIQLANKLGIGRTSVVNWETDYIKPPVEIIEQIAIVLDVTKEWLLNDTDDFNYLPDEKVIEKRSPTEFGKKLTLLRKTKSMTLEDMSKLLNMSRQGYLKYEKSVTEPSIDTLKKLSRIHKVSLDDLVGTNEDPEQEISVFDKRIEDWVVEIIKARGNKKEVIKNIWNEIKNL